MFKGTQVLDTHGHVSGPPVVNSWIDMGFASGHVGQSPYRIGDGKSGIRADGGTLSDEAMLAANTRHADWMTDRNIDVQVIGPRPFRMMGWMPRHLLQRWCEFTNDTINHQTQNFPDRFLSTTMLPQIAEAPDLSNCVPEFEFNLKERGFVGTYLSPDPDGRHNSPGMNEAYWHPVYEKCQEYDVPVFIHGSNCLDPRIAHIPGNYQVGFVVETFLATRILAYSDLFEKFPKLRICIAHGGGALDRFVSSSNHANAKAIAGKNNLFFDTCLYDIDYLALSIKQWGVANTAFGTEAPGSGGAIRQAEDHPSQLNLGRTSDDLLPIIDANPALSEQDKIDIIHNNPLKVFPQFARIPPK